MWKSQGFRHPQPLDAAIDAGYPRGESVKVPDFIGDFGVSDGSAGLQLLARQGESPGNSGA